MLTERLCKLLTLDFLRKSEKRLEEPVIMGQSCSKPLQMQEGTKQGQVGDDDDNFQYSDASATIAQLPRQPSPTIAQLPPLVDTKATSGSKRNRDGIFSSLRRSILRVGSRVDRSGSAVLDSSSNKDKNVPNSPRARASTYSHVHDVVMYNLSEAEISKHDQNVPMGVIGLRNLGNTCFLNSSLQCLSATIPLTDYFLGYDYRSEINKNNFLGTRGKLVTAYAELTKHMWLGSKSAVEPVDFKKQLQTFAPQFLGYHQHDAQELLAFLLDGIHEDLNRVKERPYVEDRDCDGTNDENDAVQNWKNYLRRNKSLIVDMFQGQIRNTCKCLKCGHVNIRFEPFMYLSLPITKACNSIDDCMDLYLKEDVLKGANQYYCGKCKEHVDGTKKQDIWMLPPVLIVHLKRFKYNDYGKVGSKNDASIRYPVTEWDLKSRVKSERGVYPKYDLYAVSNHMGGLGGGHYTAHTLNRFDDTWYEFNDSSYRSVDESIHEQLFKSSYVLFYNRSEGDTSMPLNERSPLIRRQSVSRPDLWPHSQVDDPRKVRNFTRSRRFADSAADLPDSMTQRKSAPQSPSTAAAVAIDTNGSSGSPSRGALSSITEGGAKMPPVEFMTGKNNFVPIAQRKIAMPSLNYRPRLDFDQRYEPASSIIASLSSSRTRPDPSGALGTLPKVVRRTNGSIKPKQI
jgi:ubiquitin carboxyl-terminal hydrolase 8